MVSMSDVPIAARVAGETQWHMLEPQWTLTEQLITLTTKLYERTGQHWLRAVTIDAEMGIRMGILPGQSARIHTPVGVVHVEVAHVMPKGVEHDPGDEDRR